MEYTIDYLLSFGDKFTSFVFNIMLEPTNYATDVLFKSISYNFTTFSGEALYFKVPSLGIVGTIFDALIDIVFFPNTVVGWVTGVEIPFIVSLLSMMLWVPIFMGLLSIAVKITRLVLGLS